MGQANGKYEREFELFHAPTGRVSFGVNIFQKIDGKEVQIDSYEITREEFGRRLIVTGKPYFMDWGNHALSGGNVTAALSATWGEKI